MINNICANCIHAEVCRWCDSVTQDVCDFYEDDGDWIKADVLQEIRQEITNLIKTYLSPSCPFSYVREEEVIEIIDSKIKELSE